MYVRKMAALIGAFGALGTGAFYIADAIGARQGSATPSSVVPTGTRAAAVLNEAGGGSGTAKGSCGRERWAVKTLADPDAKNINLTPVSSTITGLGSIPPPPAARDLPRQPQERNVYRVQGTIVAFKQEADSDIHLAIADPSPGPHPTMIAEFPALHCDTGAFDEAAIDKARGDFVTAYGQPSGKFRTPTGCVTLTGVFFFDRIHGQFGVAPNGAELHPVLAFQDGCAGQPATPAASPTTTR